MHALYNRVVMHANAPILQDLYEDCIPGTVLRTQDAAGLSLYHEDTCKIYYITSVVYRCIPICVHSLGLLLFQMDNGLLRHIPKVLVHIVQLNMHIIIHNERFDAVLEQLITCILSDPYDSYNKGHSISIPCECLILDRKCTCIVRACPHTHRRGDPPGFIRRLYSGKPIFSNTGVAPFVTVPRGYL